MNLRSKKEKALEQSIANAQKWYWCFATVFFNKSPGCIELFFVCKVLYLPDYELLQSIGSTSQKMQNEKKKTYMSLQSIVTPAKAWKKRDF